MKIKLFTLLACAGILLTACDTSDDILMSQKQYMQLEILEGEYESNNPFPCTIFDYNEWVLIEYTTDGLEHTDIMPFLCVNKIYNQSYLLIGYEDALVLAEYNLLNRSIGDNAIFMTTVDGYNKYSFAKIKHENELISGYEIISEIAEPEQKINSNKSKEKDFQKSYSSSLVRIFEKHLNEFDSKVSLWIDGTGDATGYFQGNIKMLGWAITGAINAVRAELLEIPDLDEETKLSIKSNIGESLILSVIKRPWRMMWNASIAALQKTGLGNMFIEQYHEIYDMFSTEEQVNIIPMFSSNRVIDDLYPLKTEIKNQVPKYVLSLSLENVGETTAALSASYRFGYDVQMSYVSSMGIECWSKSTGDKITMESNFSGTIQLTDLKPLTDYICCAYMTSFGVKYRSNCVDFITKGDLTLTPTEIHFGVEGGADNVFFSVQRNSIAAWDYTAPQWCKVEKYEDWFRIAAGENTGTKPLSGNVNISMVLKSGKKTQASLHVVQDMPETVVPDDKTDVGSGEWDGTTWYFSNGSKFDFNFTVKNLEAQNVLWGGFLDDSNWSEGASLIEKTDDGLFIGKQASWNGIGIHKVEINIVRTSRNAAKAALTYSTIPLFGNANVETAVLNGTRK